MSGRIRTGDLTILIASAAAMAALAFVSFAIAPPDATPRAPGSSFSAEPGGTRAAYLLLQALGHRISRSFDPVASLRVDPARTMLVLASPIERPSDGDRKALDSFVRRGGLVAAFGSRAAEFLPGAPPSPAGARDRPLEAVPAVLPGRLTRGTRELSAHPGLVPALDAAYAPVFASDGRAAVVVGRFGEGEVIWCLDETLIQNEGIARGSNVNLIANAAGSPGTRAILWDEYYHGERRSFWSYLADTPLPWGGAQLALVALVVGAGVSRRRGPVRPRPVEPRSSPLEFVDTMASLYERAGDARAAVAAVRDRLRRRLAVAAGIAVTASDDRLLSAAAARLGPHLDRTRAALAASADVLRRGAGSTREAVAIVAELQELMELPAVSVR